MTDLFEILHEFIQNGLTWATATSVILLLLKWQEGRKKKQAYERMEAKIDTIMQKEGVAWTGQPNECQPVQMSLKQLQQLYWEATSRVGNLYKRRVGRMDQKVNWLTLIPAVFGAIKLILQPFGIDLTHVTDQNVNDIANGVAAVTTIIGIFATHKKGAADNGSRFLAEDNR